MSELKQDIGAKPPIDATPSAKAAVKEAEKSSGKSADPHEIAVHEKKEKDVKKTTEEATKAKCTGEEMAKDKGCCK